ncbi:MAG: hypothetical protein PHU14_15165 [Methylovulum sp.]|nr:hypothetical protein [Methylovulum sp.]
MIPVFRANTKQNLLMTVCVTVDEYGTVYANLLQIHEIEAIWQGIKMCGDYQNNGHSGYNGCF